MAKLRRSPWPAFFARQATKLTRKAIGAGVRTMSQAAKPLLEHHKSPPGDGEWLAGVALSASGARRYRLFRPSGMRRGERVPLLVMLHGCGQDARTFAASTRMNVVAARERFIVLYPEQDRLANANGCWNWFDTRSGRADAEAASIMVAIDQVCALYPVDAARVAIAGLSAGASMAALLAAQHPSRFAAVVMHSGVPPGTAHGAVSAMAAMRGRRPTRPMEAAADIEHQALPPLMVIHGTADTVVSSTNAHAAVHAWAEACGAHAAEPRLVKRGHRHPMQVTDYKHAGRVQATLVEIRSLSHAWSGGAPAEHFTDPKGPDASRMLWTFASRQFARSAVK